MRTPHLLVTVLTVAAVSLVVDAAAQTAASNDVIVGAWTLNRGASDLGAAGEGNGDGREGRDGRDGGGRRGGGGFGGGVGRQGFGNQQPQNQEAMQRLRDALRQELQAPDHMTIVSSATTVIITTPDGHTTRLATDGSKIKDESTGVERKTKWDRGKLVSEVSGLGRGKITETYSVDVDAKQLSVKLEIDGPRKTTETRVYDLDSK